MRFRFGLETRGKILLGAGGVLLLAILSVPLWIDVVAQRAFVRTATASLGVQAGLGDVDIAIFGSSCTFDDLVIANPAGFRDQHFATVERGEISVDLATLLSDEVIAPTLVMDGLVLNLERTGGKTNYGLISEHSRKVREKKGKSGRRFIIRKVVIRNVKVRYRVSMAGFSPGLPLEIARIELEDIGGKGRGAYLSDVIDIVLAGVLETIAKLPKEKIPNAIGEGLKKLTNLFK